MPFSSFLIHVFRWLASSETQERRRREFHGMERQRLGLGRGESSPQRLRVLPHTHLSSRETLAQTHIQHSSPIINSLAGNAKPTAYDDFDAVDRHTDVTKETTWLAPGSGCIEVCSWALPEPSIAYAPVAPTGRRPSPASAMRAPVKLYTNVHDKDACRCYSSSVSP